MNFNDVIKLAHRYELDNQPQSAWSLEVVDQAIKALANEGNVIIEVALAYYAQAEIREDFPAKPYNRLYKDSINRQLVESWNEFVNRSASEAVHLKKDLLEEQKSKAEISPEQNLLIRLSWASEIEWRQKYGRNLIQLIDGDINHPEIGQDRNGIIYRFIYPEAFPTYRRTTSDTTFSLKGSQVPENKKGRKIFSRAEDICKNLPKIKASLFPFMITERKKILPEEEIIPEIISFQLTYSDDWEGIRTIVLLNDSNPDNEPLYDYWRVELLGDGEFRFLG